MRPEIKKRVQHRLSIAEGQVRGLQKMVNEDKYCIDVITQSSAIREALASVEALMLENHLSTHVQDQIKKGDTGRVVEEVLAVYKLANRNK